MNVSMAAQGLTTCDVGNEVGVNVSMAAQGLRICDDRRGDYVLRLESENARLRDLLERYDGTDASEEWKRDVREMLRQ